MFLIHILFILLIQFSKDSWHDWKERITYKASVVEFEPYPVTLEELRRYPFEYVASNVELMEKFILQAKKEDSKIIVFPEYGLNHMKASDLSPEDGVEIAQILPNPLPEHIPLCIQGTVSKSQQHLQKISCYAMTNDMIIIANLVTMEEIKSEGRNQNIFYNTNVAFDRDGRIIARYRKFHLYNEPLISPPEKFDISVFETSFGAKVGMMICFDIMFEEPMQSLLSAGVDVIAYPTLWFDELPFLTGLEFHSGIARSSKVNILSACYHSLKTGTTGSGIYSFRDGVKAFTWNEKPRIVSGTLETMHHSEPIAKEHYNNKNASPIFFHEDLRHYEFEEVPIGEGIVQIERKGVRCRLKYTLRFASIKSNKTSGYMLIGRKGIRTFGTVYKGGIQVCGVVYCNNVQDRFNCGLPPKIDSTISRDFIFKQLELSGIFEEGVVPTPVSLDSHFHPLTITKYGKRKSNEFFHLIKGTIHNLFSFGLYGRIYSLDPPNEL